MQIYSIFTMLKPLPIRLYIKLAPVQVHYTLMTADTSLQFLQSNTCQVSLSVSKIIIFMFYF